MAKKKGGFAPGGMLGAAPARGLGAAPGRGLGKAPGGLGPVAQPARSVGKPMMPPTPAAVAMKAPGKGKRR